MMAEHIDDFIETKARTDSSYALAYAVLQLAQAQKETALAIKGLDLAYIGERIDEGTSAMASAIAAAGE